MVNTIMLAMESSHEDKACSFLQTKEHLNVCKAHS